jgi:hypothetical protein
MCRCSERHVVAGCGVVRLGRASQHGRTAFRADSNLVRESRSAESKHGRSPAAAELIADDSEMEAGGGACALMAQCTASLR